MRLGSSRLLAPLLIAWGASCCSGPSSEPEITVYAAASLREALLEAAPACEAEARARFVFNFGGSGDLARQILAARRADVFLSAGDEEVDRLERAGLVAPGTRARFLSNRLVVVAPSGAALAFTGPESLIAPEVFLISIADPDAVPAGRYAREWLRRSGVWERLGGRVLPGVDVRAALAAVESGGAQFGVVYRTDAGLSGKVKVVHEVSAGQGPEITYAAVALADREALPRSRAAEACLTGPAALAVFERHGFVVPPR